jgi:DNA-binding winged helix-turn-helix (wHTH) protein
MQEEARTWKQESPQPRVARAIRFGIYEVDFETRELRKRGVKVNLQEQPLQVLVLLITHPGQLLTRDELQKQIWFEDTLVDSELGLNTAVKKIRAALGDTAGNPRFIETLPRRGYRFIAPVQEIQREDGSLLQPEPVSFSEPASPEMEAQVPADNSPETGTLRAPFTESLHPPETRRAFKKYFYYWASVLVLAVAAGLLVREMETRKLHLFFGQHLPQRGVSVYTAVKGPNGQGSQGIGGYDLQSPGDQAFAFDYDHSGKLDHLVLYRPGAGILSIVENSGGTFTRVFESNGIGGYDLKSPQDRIFAFDYDHSGKLDHLVLYGSGTEMLWILKNEGDGIFTPVYSHFESDKAVGKAFLAPFSATDQVFPFDYDHSGELDHLVIYRPSAATISIWKNTAGIFTPVPLNMALGCGLGTHNPLSAASQAFAFDYDHTGKLDHLAIYQPGAGIISILKNTAGTMTPVYTGSGIGGYDLKSPNDLVAAFDYDHSGKSDHLLLYRPGTGLLSILKNSGGVFTPVFEGGSVGGYDLKSWHDRVFAFDYDQSGKVDHLVLYRPGTGKVSIVHFPHQ